MQTSLPESKSERAQAVNCSELGHPRGGDTFQALGAATKPVEFLRPASRGCDQKALLAAISVDTCQQWYVLATAAHPKPYSLLLPYFTDNATHRFNNVQTYILLFTGFYRIL